MQHCCLQMLIGSDPNNIKPTLITTAAYIIDSFSYHTYSCYNITRHFCFLPLYNHQLYLFQLFRSYQPIKNSLVQVTFRKCNPIGCTIKKSVLIASHKLVLLVLEMLLIVLIRFLPYLLLLPVMI